MKKTQYQCLKCYSRINLEIRDLGKLPEVIGCKQTGCDGRSLENPKLDPSKEDPDAIFFKPKSTGEWKAVKQQVKFEADSKYSDYSRTQKRKVIKTIMENFENHVKSGGLIFLPFAYFTEIKKT